MFNRFKRVMLNESAIGIIITLYSSLFTHCRSLGQMNLFFIKYANKLSTNVMFNRFKRVMLNESYLYLLYGSLLRFILHYLHIEDH